MNPKPILASLLSIYPDIIHNLAEHWLKLGAQALCLRSTEETLAHWGREMAGEGPLLNEVIRMGTIPIGELSVWVQDSTQYQVLTQRRYTYPGYPGATISKPLQHGYRIGRYARPVAGLL